MSYFDRYWEMQKGGPYDKAGHEIFKCTDCGAETNPGEGWDGAPDPGQCRDHCASKTSDWRPGIRNQRYRDNFDIIFPAAPGAGV